jgi:hypothetical protein
MTYASAESSVQDGAPLELYTFVLGATTYRLTSSLEDETFSSLAYAAAPIARAPIALVQLGKRRELEVTIDRTHALAVALLGNGVPSRAATMAILRTHRGETESRQIWAGPIAQASLGGAYLKLRIPNGMDATFDVELPVARAQRGCQHMLYGPGCGVSRNDAVFVTTGNQVATTVASVSGVSLVVAALPQPDQWARLGQAYHLASGESRSVLAQVGTTLTLDVPFATIGVGNDLAVYAGCDHSVATCRTKFSNVANFGGHPHMINENPASPTGSGGF